MNAYMPSSLKEGTVNSAIHWLSHSTTTEHDTMNGSVTVTAFHSLFDTQERLNCHSKCQTLCTILS